MSKYDYVMYDNNKSIRIYNLNKIKNLRKIKIIGSGSFGTIYLVQDESSNYYALKASKRFRFNRKEENNIICFSNDENNSGKPNDLNFIEIREMTIPINLEHPNIIKILDYVAEKDEVWILMNYYPKKLEDYINDQKEINEKILKNITYQLLCGINYLHSKLIIHRDLKLENIFYDEQNQKVIIGDFGLSRKIDYDLEPQELTIVGTSYCQPPEVLLGFRYYSFSFDIWSLGCIIGRIATGQNLFSGSELQILKELYEIYGKFNNQMLLGVEIMPNYSMIKDFQNLEDDPIGIKNYVKNLAKFNLSDEFYDLLEKILTLDPIKRISAKESLDHIWLKEYKENE